MRINDPCSSVGVYPACPCEQDCYDDPAIVTLAERNACLDDCGVASDACLAICTATYNAAEDLIGATFDACYADCDIPYLACGEACLGAYADCVTCAGCDPEDTACVDACNEACSAQAILCEDNCLSAHRGCQWGCTTTYALAEHDLSVTRAECDTACCQPDLTGPTLEYHACRWACLDAEMASDRVDLVAYRACGASCQILVDMVARSRCESDCNIVHLSRQSACESRCRGDEKKRTQQCVWNADLCSADCEDAWNEDRAPCAALGVEPACLYSCEDAATAACGVDFTCWSAFYDSCAATCPGAEAQALCEAAAANDRADCRLACCESTHGTQPYSACWLACWKINNTCVAGGGSGCASSFTACTAACLQPHTCSGCHTMAVAEFSIS